ncbi:zinc ribbon domain-containing protein [Asticcacaulis sp.]|uniref:zinc ribbon domain-containing protein n=1 Tax=Asticcacaulis sp. TaxID=1872648 RepID=UPI003F7BCFC7
MGEVLLIAVFIGLIPAAIAKGKGHSFLAWWIYGAAIWIIAFPHSLFLKKDIKALDNRDLQGGDMKKCPACAEIIRAEAIKCRYCGTEFKPAESAAPQISQEEKAASEVPEQFRD